MIFRYNNKKHLQIMTVFLFVFFKDLQTLQVQNKQI